MNLGLLIIIIVGTVLFIYGNYKMCKLVFKDEDSRVGILTFSTYIAIILCAIGFGLIKLFEWLFTIKLW